MEKLLQNKYVLYLVLFVAVTNVLGYLAIEDFNSLMVFIAICALASHFSKNMIVILGSAILGTNILYASSRMREGFKEGNAADGDTSGRGDAKISVEISFCHWYERFILLVKQENVVSTQH